MRISKVWKSCVLYFQALEIHIVSWGPIEWCPVRPRTLEEELSVNSPERAATRAALQTDPLFRPEPEELFEAGAAAFVAGTIAANGAGLDYNTSNATYPINDLLVRDWLLAPKRSADNFPTENSDKGAVHAFPSRTRPMGSTPISPEVSTEWQKATFNMHVQCKNPSSGLPSILERWTLLLTRLLRRWLGGKWLDGLPEGAEILLSG